MNVILKWQLLNMLFTNKLFLNIKILEMENIHYFDKNALKPVHKVLFYSLVCTSPPLLSPYRLHWIITSTPVLNWYNLYLTNPLSFMSYNFFNNFKYEFESTNTHRYINIKIQRTTKDEIKRKMENWFALRFSIDSIYNVYVYACRTTHEWCVLIKFSKNITFVCGSIISQQCQL